MPWNQAILEQRNKGGGKLSSERPTGLQMRLTTTWLPSSRKERHFQPTCKWDHRIRGTRSKANRVLYFFRSLNVKFRNHVEGRGCGINWGFFFKIGYMLAGAKLKKKDENIGIRIACHQPKHSFISFVNICYIFR